MRLKEKFVLFKAYFDKGWAITGYLKYGIALFGISSLNVKYTLILGLFYGVACYFIGRIWLTQGFESIEQEIYNRINPFVSDVRNHIKKKRKI